MKCDKTARLSRHFGFNSCNLHTETLLFDRDASGILLGAFYLCVFTLTRSNVQRLSKAAPFLYSVNGNVTVSIRAFVTDLQVVITYQGNFWRENISEISHVWHKVTAFRALYMSLISSACVCV